MSRWHDDVIKFDGVVPGTDGVAVETALMRLAAKAPKDPTTGLYRDHEVRMGEALVQVASESLAEERDHERATIVIHIPAGRVRVRLGVHLRSAIDCRLWDPRRVASVPACLEQSM